MAVVFSPREGKPNIGDLVARLASGGEGYVSLAELKEAAGITADPLELTGSASLHELVGTPDTPAVGHLLLYAKTDKGLYTLDSDGNEVAHSGDCEVSRRMPMIPTILNIVGSKATARWFDGVTGSLRWAVPVPSDWIEDTDIVLNVLCIQVTTDGSPTSVFKSSIQAKSAGETIDMNIENLAPCNRALLKNVHVTLTRTISGEDIEHGELIDWALYRYGGDAEDAVNSTVYCMMGAWIEYAACTGT